MVERKLAVIDVKPGAAMETQSGLQASRPRIYGAYEEPVRGQEKKCAAIVMHPSSNFMGHYLINPLAGRDICCMGLNSRYAGNDSVLIMERVIQDLGAGVKFLRELGYERVLLIGNSGGGALAAFYQAQAENLSVKSTPAGDPVNIDESDLPPADGIVLNAAHAGRSALLREWIDPSLVDETDNLSVDKRLDMYDTNNGPPYSEDFLKQYREAQRRRIERIEKRVWKRLNLLRETPQGPEDEAFIIYRTHADPRFLDLSMDSNDRPKGSIWGDARTINYGVNAMGRYTSCKAFLSQWSSVSNADGPTNLARTSVPVLFLEHTADGSTYPSTREMWLAASGERATSIQVKNGTHYLSGQPELIDFVADNIAEWAWSLD